MLRRYSKRNNLDVPKFFEASKSSESVTKMCATVTTADDKFTVIDVPGTNDPGRSAEHGRLTNEAIASMFVKTLESGFVGED